MLSKVNSRPDLVSCCSCCIIILLDVTFDNPCGDCRDYSRQNRHLPLQLVLKTFKHRHAPVSFDALLQHLLQHLVLRVHARQDSRELCVNAERVVAHLASMAARRLRRDCSSATRLAITSAELACID